jgi:hypothetical protein
VSAKAWWKESSTHYEWRRNGLVLEVQADPYWEWSARVELEPVSVELSGECLADTAEQAKADAVRKLRLPSRSSPGPPATSRPSWASRLVDVFERATAYRRLPPVGSGLNHGLHDHDSNNHACQKGCFHGASPPCEG